MKANTSEFKDENIRRDNEVLEELGVELAKNRAIEFYIYFINALFIGYHSPGEFMKNSEAFSKVRGFRRFRTKLRGKLSRWKWSVLH